MRRGGQAFYLHNRVETIEEVGEKLRQLCPGLRFLVAHGQMGERDLEERMHAFLAGDADVLVSTTIIESGIDIPQANTLIVERADALGLSQLYQIRGRVGRSDVTAHAYLFYPDADRADPGGARAPGDARRPHRARRRLPDRHARPRDPGRRRPARCRAVRATLRLSGSSSTSRCSTKPSRSSPARLARPSAPSASMRASTRSSPPRTSPPRHSRSTCTGASRSSSTTTSSASSAPGVEDRYGPLPEPVENLFAIQEAKLKLALIGADYLVYRGGRATVGPLALGSDELRSLRAARDTLVYTQAKREVSLRTDDLKGALGLADAIVAARSAA